MQRMKKRVKTKGRSPYGPMPNRQSPGQHRQHQETVKEKQNKKAQTETNLKSERRGRKNRAGQGTQRRKRRPLPPQHTATKKRTYHKNKKKRTKHRRRTTKCSRRKRGEVAERKRERAKPTGGKGAVLRSAAGRDEGERGGRG